MAARGSGRHGREKLKLPVLSSAPGVGRRRDAPGEESQLLLAPAPWTPRSPGECASRREGVNLRPPWLPNQAQAAGNPSCRPGKEKLASLPAGPPPATDRLSSAHRGPIHGRPPGAQHPPAIP